MNVGDLKDYWSTHGVPDHADVMLQVTEYYFETMQDHEPLTRIHGAELGSTRYDNDTNTVWVYGPERKLQKAERPKVLKEKRDALHPTTEEVLKYFNYQHLPPHLQSISRACHDLMVEMVNTLPCNPQLTRGLHKLLEAKDCFVRANVKPGDHCGTRVEGGETYIHSTPIGVENTRERKMYDYTT